MSLELKQADNVEKRATMYETSLVHVYTYPSSSLSLCPLYRLPTHNGCAKLITKIDCEKLAYRQL